MLIPEKEEFLIPVVGTKYTSTLNVTKEKIDQFAHFSGDYNQVHVDSEAARGYGFSRQVAHGAILFAEVSRIIGMELPGEGAFWIDNTLGFLGAVYPGEQVTFHAEVVESSATLSMIKLKVDAHTPSKKVLESESRVICLRKLQRSLPVPKIEESKVLVVGGSRGLGVEIVKVFLEAGYPVATLSRNTNPELDQVRQQYPQLETHFIDITDQNALTDLINRLEGVNIIVHSASPTALKTKFTPQLYQEILKFQDLYLDSLIQILSGLLPKMRKNKFGRIITVGTSYILGAPPSGMTPYVVAKEALWGFTKCLSVEFAKDGITANMISPGMMITDMTSDIANTTKQFEASANPMGRLSEPWEVAKIIKFLCSPEASFINGANIPVTGGKY